MIAECTPDRKKIAQLLILTLLLTATFGCDQGKESLHDMDHFVPEHWPTDMRDAADKIGERLAIIQDSEQDAAIQATAQKELQDLVAWVPEIAADTDIGEAEWMPIYELSEEIRKQLKPGEPAGEQQISKLSDLQQLLNTTHELPASI